MAVVLVLADVMAITEKLYAEITERLEASERLLVWAADLKALVNQVKEIVGSLPEATTVSTSVEATNKLLREILDWIAKDADYVEQASCCSLFVHAKNYSGEVTRFEERLRKQVELLSQLVTIKSIENAASSVIKNAEARNYWIRNFGNTERTVSWGLMEGSFRQNFGLDQSHLKVLKSTLLTNTEDNAAEVIGNDVNIFRFSEVFSEGSVQETVSSFVQDAAEKKRVWHINAIDPQSKNQLDVDAGFVLVPEGGSLSTIRAAIIAELEDDEDLEEQLEFLKLAPGKFHFYLKAANGKPTRVKKNQEGLLKGADVIDNACLVPDKEGIAILDKCFRAGKKIDGYTPSIGDHISIGKEKSGGLVSSFKIMPIDTPTAVAVATPVGNKVAPAPVAADDDDDIAILDAGYAQMKSAQRQADQAVAAVLTVQDILDDDILLHQFRKVLVSLGIHESNIHFLKKMQESYGLDSVSAYQKEGNDGSRELLLSDSTRNKLVAFKVGESTAQKEQQLLSTMQMDVVSRLSQAPLDKLKKELVKAPRLKGMGKGIKIAIIGGGIGGAFTCSILRERLPDASIILIDTKEYYEDTTMVIRGMIKKDYWQNKGHTLHSSYLRLDEKHDQLIIGRAVELTSTHVVVGANKQKVPFDYCINMSGSTYTSDIKTDNITADHRGMRMDKERENIGRAERIVVIGGGLVGVEMAAFILEEFPGKPVSLFHRPSELLNRLPGGHQLTIEYLRDKGCKVFCNATVGSFQMDDDNKGFFPVEYTGADAGSEVRTAEHVVDIDGVADPTTSVVPPNKISLDGLKVYWCTGYSPNTQHFKAGSSEFASCLDSRGFVRVNDHLQLDAADNVFCGGDCLSDNRFANGERNAHYAGLHAVCIAKNIARLVQKRDPACGTAEDDLSLLRFAPDKHQAASMAIIDLGSVHGLMVIPKNYDPLIAWFGEDAAAVEGILKPTPPSPLIGPDDLPTRIGLVPGAAQFKEGFTGSMMGMIKAGGAGIYDLEFGNNHMLGLIK